MGAGATANPYNWRPPYNPAPIVDLSSGVSSPQMDRALRDLTAVLQGLATLNVNQYGARGDGNSDDTGAFQQAVNQAVALGGAIINVPPGTYSVYPIYIPASNPIAPIEFAGQGAATIMLRRNVQQSGGVYIPADYPPETGMFDIKGSDVYFTNMVMDGNVLVPRGLQYGIDFATPGKPNDPMAPSLTTNTTVWVHANTSRISFYRVKFQHAAGYSIILDSRAGNVMDVDIVNCWFENNRPTLFGTTIGDLNYGSWNGGVFAVGDGTAPGTGHVGGLLVEGCRWRRNTGNCIWSGSYNLFDYHQDFRIIGNFLEDCGLDGILPQVVSNGVVANNVLHRVGYVTLDDTSPPIPRWLVNLNATAIDTGELIGFVIANNSMTSINGGCIDLDAFGSGTVVGNNCRIPLPGEPQYDEDQIAITGPTNSGNGSYGCNGGNTFSVATGAKNIGIYGNTFINLPAGAIRLYSAKDVKVIGNFVWAPPNSSYPPIRMGPQGSDPSQRQYNVVVSHNTFDWSPPVPTAAVQEDESLSAYLPGEMNFCFGNNPLLPNGTNAFEFGKAASSSSTIYGTQVWFP